MVSSKRVEGRGRGGWEGGGEEGGREGERREGGRGRWRRVEVGEGEGDEDINGTEGMERAMELNGEKGIVCTFSLFLLPSMF